MEKANAKCGKIKQLYENCFREWYSERFLNGHLVPGCQDEFEEYKECVVAAMQSNGTDKLVNKEDMPKSRKSS